MTNRDVLNVDGLERLLLRIDESTVENNDYMEDNGYPKYGCTIDLIMRQSGIECFNLGSNCAKCIHQWLDEEYDGTWELD